MFFEVYGIGVAQRVQTFQSFWKLQGLETQRFSLEVVPAPFLFGPVACTDGPSGFKSLGIAPECLTSITLCMFLRSYSTLSFF